MILNRKYIIYLLLFSLFIISASIFFFINKDKKLISSNEITLTKAIFSELPGWEDVEIFTAKKALQESCERILKKNPSTIIKVFDIVINLGSYQTFCDQLKKTNNNQNLKNLIEASFNIIKIEEQKREAFFTGYIELELKGRLEPSFSEAPNAIPIYKKPNNLITIDLGLFKEELKNKKIKGVIESGKFVPAPTREKIEKKELFKNKILAYIDDPARAYFLHIQGSGTIELSNGESMAVGYDGDNGHDYFSIGRSLIREGIIAKENISMQSISKWMQENKKEAASLRQKNKRFIFFKERKKAEPVGASGTIVTPMHSAAVDNNFLMYHLPLWVNVENFYTDRPAKEYSNLFIAQDTGSAIKGATRIDLFLGKGKNAEKLAGSLNSNGSLWIFVPK